MNRRLLVAVIFISCLTASFIGGMTVGADEPVEVKLTNLLRTELEITEGIEVIVSRIEIPAGTTLPTHYHPGEEFVYMLEGEGTAWMKDKPDVQLKEGDVFKVPLKQIHTAKTGQKGFKALVFRVHKKGEPERIPAD